jgi:Bacterial EndoU nuclease
MRNDILTDRGLHRIFEGELIETRGGRPRLRGFHLEDPGVIRAKGIALIEASRTAPDSRGVYLARIELQGVTRKHAYDSFFPVAWSRDEVRAAIAEAYSNRKAVGWVDGGRFFKGQTRAGMSIIMEVDESDRVIDAFPRRAGSNLANRKRDALFRVERGVRRRDRLVCGECHALKVLVCPNGHNPPQRRPSMWGRLLRALHISPDLLRSGGLSR